MAGSEGTTYDTNLPPNCHLFCHIFNLVLALELQEPKIKGVKPKIMLCQPCLAEAKDGDPIMGMASLEARAARQIMTVYAAPESIGNPRTEAPLSIREVAEVCPFGYTVVR